MFGMRPYVTGYIHVDHFVTFTCSPGLLTKWYRSMDGFAETSDHTLDRFDFSDRLVPPCNDRLTTALGPEDARSDSAVRLLPLCTVHMPAGQRMGFIDWP